jgi:hypothetical protein
MNRIMAPFAAATKASRLQGKSRRVRGSVPFGGSNGLSWLSHRHKYCPNGDTGVRSQPASCVGAPGSVKARSWPLPPAPRKLNFAGKMLQRSGVRALWGPR